MANFWRSFNRGSQATANAYNLYRQVKQNKELADAYEVDQEASTEYTPEQIKGLTDQAELNGGTWDASKQAYRMPNGGLQAPTNTPTVENGQYQNSQGRAVMPQTRYSLGGQTQAQPFSPEQISDERAQQAASVFGKFGDPLSATRLQSNNMQMKAGRVNLENAKIKAKQVAAEAKLLEFGQKVSTGEMTEEEAVSQVINIADKANGDKSTFAYEPIPQTNSYRITELVDNKKVGSKVGTFDDIMREALRYASPENYQTMSAQNMAQRNADRAFEQKDTQFKATNALGERRLNETMDYRNRALGVQREGMRNRDRYLRSLGSQRRGLASSPEMANQKTLLDQMTKQYIETKDPEARNRLARGITMIRQNVALANGKNPTLSKSQMESESPRNQDPIEAALYKQFSNGSMTMEEFKQAVSDHRTSLALDNVMSELPPKNGASGRIRPAN